uniref:Uncharacterized protein n=1 Tax=Erpetoichthys calabaricus TaxID=27687 RepID=A0A8C4S7L5_ERPCA
QWGHMIMHGDALTVAIVPVVFGTIGFTSTGIAEGSVAAKMMSSAAITNGGGVAAGGVIATLQSLDSTNLLNLKE